MVPSAIIGQSGDFLWHYSSVHAFLNWGSLTACLVLYPGLEIHFFLVVANFCYQVQNLVAKLILW